MLSYIYILIYKFYIIIIIFNGERGSLKTKCLRPMKVIIQL